MRFLKVQCELIEDSNITANEFRIYVYLLSLYNEDKGCAYPSMEVISEKTNISLSTVKRSIKKLVELGYMTIEKKKSINGNYNEYKKMKHLIKGKQSPQIKKPVKNEPKPMIVSDCKESGIQIAIEDIPELCPYSIEHQQKISLVLKHDIKLTSKQEFLIGDMELDTLRQALRLFKKKGGKRFALLLNIYIDLAEQNYVEVSRDIERYLKGSYIRPSKEDKETRQALLELDLYGVPVYPN